MANGKAGFVHVVKPGVMAIDLVLAEESKPRPQTCVEEWVRWIAHQMEWETGLRLTDNQEKVILMAFSSAFRERGACRALAAV